MKPHVSVVEAESTTLIDILRRRSIDQPDRHAYSFLLNHKEVQLTYGALDRQARQIAAQLQRITHSGERALILYPPGLDYIAAFFGCLYAGVIAVPAYPPQSNRPTARVQAIIASAQATVALTTSQILSTIQQRFPETPELAMLQWMTTDQLSENIVSDWQAPTLEAHSPAFLQYTSGSTADPKGVIVTHSNLLNNLAHIQRCFETTPDSQGVLWLPPYHDMGLIGGILQPLFVGCPITLMSPLAFLQSPYRWLQTISQTRATINGGPNFAYELCVQKITPEQRATLDLSCWSVAFTGAEPVRAETLERFVATFAECGFRHEAFYPCYGLAEATLIVTGGAKSAAPVIQTFGGPELEQHRVRPVEAVEPQARSLVGSGRVTHDQQVLIVHDDTLTRCAADQVGEIWLSSPSVAQGYWGQPVATERTFRAYTTDTREGPFLRTGDIGFLHDGELFVTGRLKDLIIIRGRNHYPQDIEQTVERSHPVLRPTCSAVFMVDVGGEERLVIVQEVERRQRNVDTGEVIAAVRQAVAEQHGIQAYAVVLIKHGTIPKTSSGKIQRQVCSAAFAAGTLDFVASSVLDAPASSAVIDTADLDRAALLLLPDAERQAALVDDLRIRVAHVLRVDPDTINDQQAVIKLGLDSLMAVELANQIEGAFEVVMPLSLLLGSTTITDLAATISAQCVGSVSTSLPVLARANMPLPDSYPLSYGQRALWFLHQLTLQDGAYNIARAVRIRGALDLAVLQTTFQTIVSRHPALRTTLNADQGEPIQHVHTQASFDFRVTDATTWDAEFLNDQMSEIAHQAFDLEHGPLLRVTMFRRALDEHILVLTVHHTIADFWSLALMLRELDVLYSAQLSGQLDREEPRLRNALPYSEYIRWQSELLASLEGERLWTYWRQQLGGELPTLNLPLSRPRPATQTYRGAEHRFRVDSSLTGRIKQLGAQHEATLYMTLLAAFQVLLFRYTQQEDILVGTPTTGRSRAHFADTVGYFVNPVVLRTNLAGSPSFEALLAHVRQTVLEAFAHQDYPFALLAERLQPVRDPSRSPIFQVMFTLQKVPLTDVADIGAFALSEAGTILKFGTLSLESMALEQRAAQFDLLLMVAEAAEGLTASLQYNTDLFDAGIIANLAAHFQVVLGQIVAQPQLPITGWPLLTAGELQQQLYDWNATATTYPHDRCIHQLIEMQTARTPDAIAVVFADQQLSYRELNQRANQLASYLQTHGVGRDTRVGVYIDRSLDLLVGLLGILKAGAAYVPLDPSYPRERLQFMLSDAQVQTLVTRQRLVGSLGSEQTRHICLDRDWSHIAQQPVTNLTSPVTAEDPAYVIYTSGSTGRPKGVMLSHRGVVNFFSGMDERIGCDAGDTLLAVTSIAFDISVLELFWTLARGAKVVVLSEQALSDPSAQPVAARPSQRIDFSLFYFASAATVSDRAKYRMLIEGAKFADQHGFAAVWTPERHFHSFGGLYPNPSVTSAALATITEQIQIRAGSVVMPLHSPVRVAEEWSVVDNLSNGRVGLAFASGWHADDFVFFPAHYAERKEVMLRGIAEVQRLWRGESVLMEGGAHNEIAVSIYPQPIQANLPIWLTAAGNPDTFITAGELGVGVLTHLLGQSVEEVAEKIRLYRQSLVQHGYDAQSGHVTLMLHTFIGQDREQVREQVREPFTNYLRTSVGLIQNLIRSLKLDLDLTTMSSRDMDDLLAFAFDRYFESSALFGTPETCLAMIERLKAIGVDEVACLIDFGVDEAAVLEGLQQLAALKTMVDTPVTIDTYSLAYQARQHNATLLQCTPSLLRLLSLRPDTLAALQSLRVLMVGGEALPPTLAEHVKASLPARLVNMYGPTETTIWSTTHEIKSVGTTTPIGRPIANTQVYVLDRYFQPLPCGVAGELYIGGAGLALGYLHHPELTAEKFIRSPFDLATQLYKTGDLVRYRDDGTLEFLGRIDQQIKLRGYRIELEEIEAVLAQHPGVREAVVVAREDTGDTRLAAYIVPSVSDGIAKAFDDELRVFLRSVLPDYMVPSFFTLMATLPLTTNGKVDRKALPKPSALQSDLLAAATYVGPQNEMEQTIARIWQQVLQLERISTHDNFFDLGGHSLLLAQAHSQLQAVLQQDVPLIKLLEYPTVSALAQHLSQSQPSQPSFQATQHLARRQVDALKRQRQRAQKEDKTP